MLVAVKNGYLVLNFALKMLLNPFFSRTTATPPASKQCFQGMHKNVHLLTLDKVSKYTT